jgi:hypothetical protein
LVLAQNKPVMNVHYEMKGKLVIIDPASSFPTLFWVVTLRTEAE